MSEEATSQNETIRIAVSNSLDDGQNLNDLTQKKKLISKIKSDNPDFAEKSVKSTFSKYLKSESLKRGIEPKSIKGKKSFSSSMSVQTTEPKKLPSVENPLSQKNSNEPEKPKTIIPLSLCESTGNTIYSSIRLHDSDMEDLTEQERKDFGEIIKYFADTFGGGEKFSAFMMFTGMIGIMANKKRQAMKKRKDAKKLPEKKETPKIESQ